MIRVRSLDHPVLSVADETRTIASCRDVLGMEALIFGENRAALHFPRQTIDLHPAGSRTEPQTAASTTGPADLCLLVNDDPAATAAALVAAGVAVELGRVARTGATEPITSLYRRDPDGNLIELGHHGAG